MREVKLSDEENKTVFAGRFSEALKNLDEGTQQKEVLKKVRQLLDSSAPHRFIYEQATGVNVLEIMRPNDLLRIYCKLVMGVPNHQKTYNILYLFYVDKHNYREQDLQRWDQNAEAVLEYIETLQSVGDIEQHLDDMNALSADDLEEMIEQGSSAFK